MDTILCNGWSYESCAGALAIEVATEKPKFDKQYDFLEKLAETSDGMIAPPSVDLRILTLSGSHTTATLTAIIRGCKTVVERVADNNVNVDMKKVVAMCPTYERPLKEDIALHNHSCVLRGRDAWSLPIPPGR